MLLVNLRHLANQGVHLEGELSPKDLDLETHDEMIGVEGPVRYELEAELVGEELLVRGILRIKLAYQCVRCLKPFPGELNLPEWTCLLPLKGEERVAIQSDSVDLTPQIREDILLAFPQHPVCDPKCCGLAKTETGLSKTGDQSQTDTSSSAWAALNKLKL